MVIDDDDENRGGAVGNGTNGSGSNSEQPDQTHKTVQPASSDPSTPASGVDAAVDKYPELVQKMQRDLNRSLDADRMTRKRGLQKLLVSWIDCSLIGV
jgi:hypothetical protein